MLVVGPSGCGGDRPTERAEAARAATPAASPDTPSAEPPNTPSPAPREAREPPGEQAAPPSDPCPRVELEHTFRDLDDETWRTVRVPVTRFVPLTELDRLRHDVDWTRAPIAPAPLSAAELRAQHPSATEGPPGTFHITLDDSSASYTFDASGRTVRVDFDPIADSSVYRFHYGYDCARESAR